MQRPNVNVFVHGLALCVPNGSVVDVLIPNSPDHSYRAGTFLGEYLLHQRPVTMPYFLTGVEPGNADFDQDPSRNCCLYLQSNVGFDTAASPEDLWARITLPRPVEILSLRHLRDPLSMDIDPKQVLTGMRPAAVQVLRYYAPSLEDVRLEEHDAQLAPHTVDGREYLNIHITCEGDEVVETRRHHMEAFHRVFNLLPELRGTPVYSRKPVTLTSETRDFSDFGFCAEELLSQQERASFLVRYGRALRAGKPETMATAANGDPGACGVLIAILLGLLS